MLKKLMKHEWNSVYKVGTLILLILFLATIIGCIVAGSPVISNLLAEESGGADDMQLFGAVMLIMLAYIVYIMLFSGAMYGIMIYMGVHFYKTMYTDRGYLTHTLPVTSHQLLISKTVVSGIWVLLINMASILSLFILIAAFAMSIGQGAQPELNLGEIWEALRDELAYGFAENPELKKFAIVYVIVMIVSVLISPFFTVLMIFGGLTIGQLAKKHKLAMGILALIGISVVYSIVITVVGVIAAMGSAMPNMDSSVMPTNIMSTTYGITLGTMVLIGVLLYFLSHYIISKKLNMD